MRTNFKVSYGIEIRKEYGSTSAKLTFFSEEKDRVYKKIAVQLYEHDVRQIIEECVKYLKSVEDESKTSLSNLRAAFNYSNSNVKITYEQ